MIDLIKSPRQILMDETGLPQLETGLLNNTQPYGVQGHATGGAIEKNLSPADMEAAMIYSGRTPPKFNYDVGGKVAKWTMNEIVPMMEHLKNKAAFSDPSAVKGTWYHGSPGVEKASNEARKELHANGITQFDPQRSKTGMMFASDQPRFANSFAEQNGSDLNAVNAPRGTSPAVYPVVVHSKNPFDYENPEHVENLVNHLASKGHIEQINPENPSMSAVNKALRAGAGRDFSQGHWDELEKPHVVQAVKDLGHDGMYVNEGGFKNIGVFDPGQFKSAIGNQGTYDVTNPDIRKASGGVIDKALPHVGHAFALDPLYEMAKAIASRKWGHALQSAGDLAQVYSPMKAALPAQLAMYSPELNSNEDAELAARRAMPPLSTIQPNR